MRLSLCPGEDPGVRSPDAGPPLTGEPLAPRTPQVPAPSAGGPPPSLRRQR